MTTKQALSLGVEDFNKMSRRDLARVVSTLGATANKRYKAFGGAATPATRMFEQSGGKITTKGKSLNELRAEYVRARNFLEAETSTKRGFAAYREDIIEKLNLEGVDDLTPDQFSKLWKVYDLLKEKSPEVANKRFKYTVLEVIADQIVSNGRLSAKTIARRMSAELSDIYESEAAEDDTGVSGFFEFE